LVIDKKPDNKGTTVITTHTNADYDSIASLLAAQKLYPGSVVVFPGSSEKNIRNFFISSMVYIFNMVDIKKVDFSKIQTLVLVDTRRKNRIGKLSSLIGRAGVDIHIYDHHPPMAGDIESKHDIYEPTGATVTMLVNIIKEKGIKVSPDEATMMCLGIYEDTGSFTFSSTTEKDFKAAAFLLSKGASLNTISDLTAREINPQQIGILNDMIRSATHYDVNGVDVVVTTISTHGYVPDFAFLVHKMLRMENFNSLFAIARMENKIYIVARSRIREVDAAAIVTPLGGGGHSFAASASIRNKTLAQTEHLLIETLYKKVWSTRQIKDIMSSPAITVAPDVSCNDASKILTRYNINTLLVTTKNNKEETLLGYISRQVIEKAMHHSLGHVKLKEYMTTELFSTSPDADILEIQEKIIEQKQRILPVVENSLILGVVTRTDLLNLLVYHSQKKDGKQRDPLDNNMHARTKKIVSFMEERLSKNIIDILRTIGKAAEEMGCGAYVVGGFVRDLFLYRPNEDLDIVIEGDGIEFAKQFAKKSGARINAHEKFHTAVIIFPDGFKIDVASARMEYYKFPASLPVVEMGSIKLDLFRRDFTINTLSIQLNPGRFGILIDFFSAQRDIKDKVIRILHNLSFVEDPTRVFRAIRFEQRFDFTIGKLTSGLVKNAVKMDFFKRLSGRRVFAELRLLLEEENPAPAIIRFNDYNLLKVIHPSIKLDNNLIKMLNSARKVLAWYDLLFLEESYKKWAVYFLAILMQCGEKTSDEICTRFELSPRLRKVFGKDRFAADACLFWLDRHLPLKNSVLYKHLSVFKTELLLYMMAASKHKKVKKSISFYCTQLRDITVSIKGKDLMEKGIPPGPIYRKIFEAVLDAKLNGHLKSPEDELFFAQDYV
jgi:tRNA nucleotidyltransferase (CCA-adding enzyme)